MSSELLKEATIIHFSIYSYLAKLAEAFLNVEQGTLIEDLRRKVRNSTFLVPYSLFGVSCSTFLQSYKTMKNPFSPSTLCVHSGTWEDEKTRGVVTPVFPATSYAYLDTEIKAYPRYYNIPNHRVLVEKLTALEGAEAGLIFSSGMAAISTTLLSLLGQGDHAVFQYGLYGGSSNLVRKEFPKFGIEYTFTESTDISTFKQGIRPNTKLIYIETPANPLLTITDIAAIAQLAKAHGLVTVIDNTFASPINQRPIELGIDLVIHSATKYLGGHSDICAGVAVGNKELMDRVYASAKNYGGSLNAETLALLERSLKTLAIRVAQQNINAQTVAEFLHQHPDVAKVNYPGLPDHAGHEIAKKQMDGFGGMLSFELNENINAVTFQQQLKLIYASMSLGGVESTICSSALTSHAYLTSEQRKAEGISDGLLRLSVGIEDVNDLINDLKQALDVKSSALL